MIKFQCKICAAILMLINSCCGCQDNGSIVLTGGRNPREGRVEICLGGVLGTVCDSNWDREDATVVCRQLGFSDQGSTARHEGDFPRDSGHVHRTRYHCTGREERLVLCRSEPSACNREDSAGVICNDESCVPGALRLRDGDSRSSGRVEICMQQRWGTICDNNWGAAESAVTCRQLGFPSEDSIPVSFGSFQKTTAVDHIHLSNVQCTGSEAQLISCQHSSNTDTCSHSEDTGVVCKGACSNGDVRLVDAQGMAAEQGRVEVCLDEQWACVCDNDMWTEQDARVVCQQLGHTESQTLDTAQLEPFRGPQHNRILLFHNVNCTGTETKLTHCQTINHLNPQSATCTHQDSVGVSCATSSEPSTVEMPNTTPHTTRPPDSTSRDSGTATQHSTSVSSQPDEDSTSRMYPSPFPVPWVIAGASGVLLASIIATNILICATMLKKRQQKQIPPEPEMGSDGNRPSSTYDYVEAEYTTNPAYGGSIRRDTVFNIDSNPSYRTISDTDFDIEKNPSYKIHSSSSFKI